jgi:hypothetical protein
LPHPKNRIFDSGRTLFLFGITAGMLIIPGNKWRGTLQDGTPAAEACVLPVRVACAAGGVREW